MGCGAPECQEPEVGGSRGGRERRGRGQTGRRAQLRAGRGGGRADCGGRSPAQRLLAATVAAAPAPGGGEVRGSKAKGGERAAAAGRLKPGLQKMSAGAEETRPPRARPKRRRPASRRRDARAAAARAGAVAREGHSVGVHRNRPVPRLQVALFPVIRSQVVTHDLSGGGGAGAVWGVRSCGRRSTSPPHKQMAVPAGSAPRQAAASRWPGRPALPLAGGGGGGGGAHLGRHDGGPPLLRRLCLVAVPFAFSNGQSRASAQGNRQLRASALVTGSRIGGLA
jgi:hypothetical protein